MLGFLLTLGCTLLSQGGEDPPMDRIQLTRGKPIEGIILRHDESGVWLAKKSRIKHYDLAEVISMEGPRVNYPEYLKKLREEFREPPSAERSTAMGKWCEERGLVRDAQNYYWRALIAEGDYAPAHEALGHKKYKGRFRIKVKGKSKMSFAELRKYRQSSYSKGWQLTTAHFDIQAGCDLPELLNAAADLELLYQAYYQTFQPVVGFWEIREPMRVQLYAHKDDMPPVSGNVSSYFQPELRTLFCYFKDGVAQELLHEATHAITHGSIREFARDEPAVPGWFWEGMANYFAKGFTGNPGDLNFLPTRPHLEFFETQLTHDKPDSIQRVMNYQSSDFMASTDQSLKYAESYTLFFYLMNSGDEETLEKTRDFLASIYKRKGSSSHFKNAMGVRNWDDFEEDWFAYVKKIGESGLAPPPK